jgi:hypothetical protein
MWIPTANLAVNLLSTDVAICLFHGIQYHYALRRQSVA